MKPDSSAALAYRETPMPDSSVSWREATFCVLDFETTGLNPALDEIISYATVTVAGGRVHLADARYEFVRPGRMPTGESIRIHGLRTVDLEQAPPLSAALDGILEAITGRALVAHFAPVERSFLRAALAEQGLDLRNTVVDTAGLAAELGRRSDRFGRGRAPAGLTDLARALGLPVHRPHHADGDALTTAQLFVALSTLLDGPEPLTLGAMEHFEHPGPPGRWTLGRLRDNVIRSLARP